MDEAEEKWLCSLHTISIEIPLALHESLFAFSIEPDGFVSSLFKIKYWKHIYQHLKSVSCFDWRICLCATYFREIFFPYGSRVFSSILCVQRLWATLRKDHTMIFFASGSAMAYHDTIRRWPIESTVERRRRSAKALFYLQIVHIVGAVYQITVRLSPHNSLHLELVIVYAQVLSWLRRAWDLLLLPKFSKELKAIRKKNLN